MGFTTVNKNGFTPFANGRCQSLLQSKSMGSHPLLMVDVKSTTVNENALLLLLNQYVFINSMNAFLKMFWLFECWLIIYLLMHNECIFSWDFNMYTLFQQKQSNKIIKHYIFNWLIINFLLYFILSWTIIHYFFCILCLKINTVTITILFIAFWKYVPHYPLRAYGLNIQVSSCGSWSTLEEHSVLHRWIYWNTRFRQTYMLVRKV